MQKFLRTLTLMALLVVPWVTQAQPDCGSLTVPYAENFDVYTGNATGTTAPSGYPDITLPDCWTFLNMSATTSTYPQAFLSSSTTYAVSGNCLLMKSSNETPLYAILPSVGNQTAPWVLSFQYRHASTAATNGTIIVGVMSDISDANTFVALETLERTTTKTLVEITIPAGTVTNGARLALCYQGGTSNGTVAAIDNLALEMAPTCIKVTNLAIDATLTTNNSLTLTWTDAFNNGATYRIYNTSDNTIMQSGISSQTYTLTGLNPNTVYSLAVMADCGGGDFSVLSDAVTGRTACDATTPLPYAEDFNGYSGFASTSNPYTGPSIEPACWIYYSNGTNTVETTGSAYYGGVGVASGTSYGSHVANNPYLCMPIQLVGSSASATNIGYAEARGSVKYAVLPAFAQSLNGLQISFDYKMSTAYSATGAAATLELGYVTGNDVETFQSIQSYQAVTTVQNVVELNLSELTAQAPADARLAFKFSGVHNSSTGSTIVYAGIDNILVEALPNCLHVTNMRASNITNSSVTLNWTDPNGSGNTYVITKNGEVVTSNCNQTTYTITGLTSQTEYTFAVTVNCGMEQSVPESLSAITACDAISNFPITYGFEAEEGFTGSTSAQTTNTIGQCWRNYATIGTGSNTDRVWSIYTSTSATYVHNGSQSLKLNDKGSSSAGVSKTMLVFPPMNFTASNGYVVSFWIRRDATTTNPEGFMVYASNSDTIDANAVFLGHYSRNYGIAYPNVESAADWYQYETAPINLTGTVYLIFEGQSYYGNATYVDDVEIKVAPTCIKVQNLAIEDITSNSMTLTWSDGNNTGATYTIYNMDDNTVVASNLTGTSHTITGLQPNTDYSFAVMTDCGGGDVSELTNPVSGRTACAAMNLPWTCGFEENEIESTTAATALPWCSYRYVSPEATSGTTNPYSYSSASYAHEGSRSLYYYGSTSETYPEVMTYILPAVNVASYPMNGNRVTFWARMSAATNSKEVHIGTVTDPTNYDSYAEVGQVTVSGNTYTKYTVNLTGANADAPYVAITVLRGTGTLYLDDLTLEPQPSCLEVSDVAVTLTPGNGSIATLGWTSNGTATSWQICLNDDETNLITANSNPFTVTGLTAEQAYTAKVRAYCSANDQSVWSDPISFTPTNAFSLTVYEGTVTNQYVPAYVFYWDDFTRSQVVIPADDLAAMDGGSITSMTFYTTSSNIPYTSVSVADVYLKEVNYTEISAYEPKTADAIVYSGTFDFVSADNGGMVTIEFDEPFDYNGGNLLIAIENTTDAGYKNLSYYGQTVNGASISGYNSSSLDNVTATQQNFIPKTTFTYEPPVVSACARPGVITVTDVQAHTATIEWTAGGEETSWNVYLNNVAVPNNPVTTPTYTFTGLDAETQFTVSIYSVCGSQTSEQGRDKNFITTIACQAPTDLAATLTPGNGSIATLFWTENGTATAWVLEYGTSDDFTGATSMNVSGTPSASLTGLTAETPYYARVKAVCGGEDGESQWSSTMSFTPTNAYSLTVNDGTTTNEYVPFYGYYADNDADGQFIIPATDLAAIQWGTITKLTFYVQSPESASFTNGSGVAAEYKVYMTETTNTTFASATREDVSTMTLVWNQAAVSINDSKLEITLDNPYQYMGGNLLVAFDHIVNGGYAHTYWYGVEATGASLGGYGTSSSFAQRNFLPKTTINFIPGEAPACAKPLGVAVNYTGGTTAEVSWTSDATAFNVDVNGTVISNVTNPYTLTGLNLATSYQVKVQAVCGGANSDWTNPVSFTTDLCMPENICGVTITLTDAYGDGGGNLSVVDVLTNETLETYTNSGSSTTYTLNVCDGRQLNFVFASTDSWAYENGWTITDINNDVISSHEGCSSSSSCDAPTNGIVATYTVSCAASSCRRPTNLAVTESARTAQLSWTENGEATAWVVAYKDATATDFTEVNVTTNTYTLTGLTPETGYTVKVRPVCSDQAIKWSDEVSFTTLITCPAPTELALNGGFTKAADGSYSANLTWTDNANVSAFTVTATPTEGNPIIVNATTNSATLTGLTLGETYAVNVVANCGVTDGVSSPSSTLSLFVGYCSPNPTSRDGQGITGVAFGIGQTVANADTHPTASPFYGDYTSMIGLVPASMDANVEITYATGYSYGTIIWVDWDNSLTFDANEVVWVGESTNENPTTITATFTVPATMPQGSYRMRIAGADSYFDSYTGSIEAAANANPCFSSSWAVAEDYTLRVGDAPSCMPVANVTVSNVTATGATISWTDSENEATYTIYNNADNSVVANNVNAMTYELTGLASNTEYSFAVEPNCLGANGSAVSVSFTTPQVAATMPYTANFEDATDNNQWTLVNGSNGWYIGTAATTEGNSLYISNDNGVSNAYTNGTQTVSYAYRTVNFTEAGWYNMAFDWMANGESTWDYLRVALVPVNAAMPASYVHDYYNTLPEGWIALDGGSKLNSSSDWNNANNAFQLTTAGQYNLVIMWSNDGSQGSNPPAAVDNIAITGKVAFEPVDLAAEIVNGNTATLTWTRDSRNNTTERYTIKEGETVLVQNLNANTYTINNVEANVDHNYTVFAVNQGENSDAATMGLGIYTFPTEPGKMVCVAGTILNATGIDAEVTLYRGLGENLTVQNSYDGSTYLTANLTNYTASNEWPVYGPMTVAFVGENATAANTGVAALTASTVCPAYIATPATVYDNANGAYTWTTPQGAVYNYENHRTAALAQNENGDIVATYSDTVRNAADCDSIYNTLQLTLHPDFTIAVNDQFCEGTTYTVGEGEEAHTYTASAQENVLLHTVNGADSVIVLNLQMNPAPVAYINNKANDVVNNYCNGFDLVLNARSNMEGVTFQWDDETTGATRTVNPQTSATYTLIAIDPTTECQSIAPATLTVNTIPVPTPHVEVTSNEICYGESVTLSVVDESGIEATYRWYTTASTATLGTEPTLTVTPTVSTGYLVTVTGTGNCAVTVGDTVVVNALPVVEVSTNVDALCANSTLTLNATAVEGYTYEWNTGATTAQTTTNPTVNGNYTVTVTDGNGCVNQFTTNNVTVYPVYELNDVQSVCFTQNPYTWGNVTIAENGNYDQTFRTVNGCDSLVHLAFTFEEMSVINSYREVCKGAEVLWGEQTVVANESTTLSYVDNTGDCPEQRNLVLTVNPVKASSFDLTVCDSYFWPVSNVNYTESGAYDYTLQTVKGCDSVVTMNLTVNYQNTGIDEKEACDEFEWNLNGVTYTESTNEPVVTLEGANVFGCDSVVTLNLTVNYKSTYIDEQRECDAMTFTWIDGQSYNLSVVPDDNVTYTLDVPNAAGCDSIAILSLTMNYVTDTLIWVDVESCDSWYIDTVACDGTIGRKYVDQSGDVVVRTRNAATGRDQISRIHLTINHSEHQTVMPEPTCVPWTWTVAEGIEHAIVSDTILSQELQTESGCQLIKVLRFTAKYPTTNTTEVTLCQNGSWTDGNNVVYNMSDYQLGENEAVLWNTTTNVAGCDSTDYVVFTVNPVYTNLTANLTYCESEFTNGQLTYVNPNDAAQTVALTIPAEGLNQQVYTNTIVANWTTAQGCDSSVTITYTVNPSVIEDVTVQNCYNYTWNGREYNTLGETVDTFETVSALTGCDSTAILYLTLTDTVIGEVVTEVCGEFTYEGEMYREDTTFRVESGVAISGCDSVTMMVFNVTPRVLRDVYVNTNIPYTWANGTTYTGSVNNIYYDATVPGGCDSILVLHLNWVNDTVVICENEVPYSGNGITISNVSVNIEEGFENGMPTDWIYIDADNDGYNWTNQYYYPTSDGDYVYEGSAHTGNAQASSASYLDYNGALNTDNWMIMPRIPAGPSTVLTWYAGYANDDYPDTYSVLVSTTGTDIADFTDVVFSGNNEPGVYDNGYAHHTVDLSAYAGQNIYVAFRHTDYDQYFILIDDVTLTGASVYHSGDVFNDTILYYVVNRNTVKTTEVTACDTYTWEENNQTYTESGEYSITGLTNANGCDSTNRLVLTVNYSSGSASTESACDSYTWNALSGERTFTESGIYYDTTLNTGNCQNIDTLNLTINVNPGVKDTVVACDSYDWNGQTLTATGDYSVSFEDANGCTADSMLHLTVNVSTEANIVSIVDAASTYYGGNYYVDILEREGEDYNMPYTFDENVGPNSNGCDSIDHVTLYVTRGIVHDENYNICGNFTWERNNHTYTWISADERAANGNAAYKDITDPAAPVYIHAGENPTKTVRKANGVADTTYVLWLNMVEANYMTIDLGTILMSQLTDSTLAVGNDTLDARTLDLRSYYVAKQGEPNFSDTIHHTSTYYCENVVTYTANLVWNYDTLDNAYVCNDVNSYEWTIGNDTFNETLTGDTTTFTETFAAGTTNEVVNTISVIRNAAIVVEDTTAVACDEFNWYGTNYTSTPATAPTHTFQVEHNGILCDSVVTLNLTINHSNTGDTTAVACDSFNWYEHTNITASVDTLTHVFTNADNCDSTVTLHLTINTNAGSETPIVQCDSYTWNVENYVFNETTQTWEMGDYISNTYTGAEETGTKTVQYTDANGCVGTATLNLTINVNNGIDTTVASCLAYTWTIQSRDEVYGTMEDITNNYSGSSDSGDKTLQFNDVNGCEGTATLHLTIYDTVNTASVDTVYGSGYTFHGHFYTPAQDGTEAVYTIIYDTVDAHNCAIKDTLTLHVSQYVYFYTNKVECGSYTWTAADNGNGHTYRVLTAEEQAANPTAAYFDVDDNIAVPNMQQHVTQGRIYVLNLTLNEPAITEHNYTVLMSVLADANYSYAVEGTTITIDCNEVATATADATVVFDDEHGQGVSCNDIDRYIVSVVYNYVTDDSVTVCYQNAYTLPNNSTEAITIGAANTLVYDIMGQEHVERHTVVVTSNAYTGNPVADTVTACDSYTWTSGNGTNYTTSGNYTWNDEANCLIDTLKLTINNSNAATDPHVACDTYTWINGTTYTASNNTDTVMLTNVDDCDSVVTLNLTVNYSNAATDPHVACDTYTWINGTTYTASNNTDTVMRTNVAGCDSVVTLNLTINVSTTGIDTVNACDSVQWNNNWYYASNNTATKTINNLAGCDSVITLNLTVNYTQYTAEEYWFGEGSYRYTGIHTAATGHMYMPGDYTVIETIEGAAEGGCNIIDTITLHVGNYRTLTEAKRSCNTFTWERNGVTYVRLTDAESEANPTALYKTEDGEMVFANPTDTVLVADNYDSIYMLDLTLDAIITVDSTIELPVSLNTLTFAGQTYGPFINNNDEGRLFAGDTLTDEIHLTAVQYCDSIINLTIHVNNSYVAVDTVDVCYTESSYTWNNQTITLAGDPDNANTYYIYNNVGDEVQYLTVNQHAIQYTTERRTECDSYNWNGTVFTESTSGATMTLPDQYGCDSTVTLTLTINHNTNTVTGSEATPVVVCDGYEWTLGNGTTLPDKVNRSGMYTYDYTTDEGCESHDTLYLTVNHSNSVELDVANCGAYTWEGVGTYTTSGTYTHTFEGANAAGCDSTVTLNLTVYEIPATVYDAPDAHVCDTFIWTGLTWNGTEMVDTVFDTITETAYSLTAFAYNENGCPIEHFISAVYIDKSSGHTDAVACDSYVWSANGETYTESGEYEYTAETENACGSLASTLSLTINRNSGHAEVVAICNSNLPAGGYEWHDNYYSTSGEYYYNYSDDNQCASTDTLKLTVGNVRTFARVDITNCGPFTWDLTGETFEESTEASTIMTGANAGGCDSVVYLYLTIYEQPVVAATDVICDNALESYSWRGIDIDAAGEYTDFGGAANEYCDSLYTLTLSVNERTYSSTDITACDSYEWNGQTYNETGSYTYTTNNAVGCDSVATLVLTINANSGSAESVVVCDSYEWNDETYTVSGEYYFEYEDGNNCASVDTLHLTIVNSENNTIEETACDSYAWVVNDDTIGTYTESGLYQYNYITTNGGCSGILNLNLTVNYSTSGTDNATACDSYEWNGETYTETGVYTYETTNVAGCDSTVTLALTIKVSTESEESATACNFYTWNNTTYTESGDYTNSSTPNAAGCDSTVTLHLTINSSDAVTISETVCDSYNWNGANYTESGAYTYATTNANGCDSIVTLNLTVNYSTTNTVEATACNSYEWVEGNGQTYTESDSYIYTIPNGNAAGCDSVVTLALTINNSSNAVENVIACDSYEWNGNTYYMSGSYTESGFTNIYGCDSTVTLVLTVNNSTTGTDNATACDSYEWNGNVYTESGDYTYNTVNAAGCDSTVTLTLTVYASTSETIDTAVCGSFTWTDGDGETYNTTGIRTFDTINADGCAHLMTLLLTINQPIQNTVNMTVCDSYEWNGMTYYASGNYSNTYTAGNGCDSIVTLALTVNNSNTGSVSATACDNYSWNGTIYTESGSYTYNTTNAAGCDSLVTLTLTVNNSTSSETTVSNCGSYEWNGVVYSQSGNYSYTTTNLAGCDSTAYLFLTVNQASSIDPISIEACGSYEWNGNVYTQSGVYYDTTNNQGCDNVAALVLTIKQPVVTTVNHTACDSYVWNNQNYIASGTYTETFENAAANGCDSIVTLNLTINQAVNNTIAATACSSYEWNGESYIASGNYTQIFTARNGCDSTVTLNLTVNQPVNTTANETACESYTWAVNGQTYTQSATYTADIIDVNNCPATATLNLTINQPLNTEETASACNSYVWNGQTYNQSGDYTYDFIDVQGCDATATLHLTVNTNTSEVVTVTACDSYDWIVDDSVVATFTETPTTQIAYNTVNAEGCSHVVYLQLTVNYSATVETSHTAVGSYTWHGTTYTESGIYTYTGHTEGGCDSTTILNLTITPAITYYQVTLASSNTSWGTVSAGDSVAENTLFTAIATPNLGYKFVSWTEEGNVVSTDSIYSFIVTSDVNLIANFEYVPIYYTVSAQVVTVMNSGDTVSGQHGSVLNTGEYESGSNVTLTAVADEGYHFVCWSNGRNTATISFTVTDDIELIAYFEEDALPQAIDETDMTNVTIFSTDTRIIVRGAEGYDVYVFDVNGRMISRQLNAAEEIEFRMAATGVYLVKVGNAPAKRVLVVR